MGMRGLRLVALVVLVAVSASGCTWIARLSVDGAGGEVAGASWDPSVSADGRYLAFVSDSAELVAGDTNGVADVFVRDNATGVVERVSVTTGGVQGDAASGGPSISADGRYVAFESAAPTLGSLPGGSVVLVRDRVSGTTTKINPASVLIASAPDISGDGRYVVYHDSSAHPFFPITTPIRVQVHDRQLGTTEPVEVTGAACPWIVFEDTCIAAYPSISDDGQTLAYFMMVADIRGFFVPYLAVGHAPAFDTPTLKMSGALCGGFGAPVENCRPRVAVSGDGETVVATLHGRAYVTDAAGGAVSEVTGAVASLGRDMSPSLSDDGRYAVFASDAGDLAGDDANGTWDVFVSDGVTDEVSMVSRHASGTTGAGASFAGTISGDGRYVAFASEAPNLVAGDHNGVSDVFMRSHPQPVLTSVTPDVVAPGATTVVTIEGSRFVAPVVVAVMGAGVTVDSTTVVSETELSVSFTVAPDAPAGPRVLIVNNAGTAPGFDSGASVICSDCLAVG